MPVSGANGNLKKWINAAQRMAGRVLQPGGVRVRRPGRNTDVRLHKNFRSRFLPGKRHIAVYMPPGYESGTQSYPVLYMQDGQNLFDPATSFVHGMDWRVDETAEKLIATGAIEPLIIVGIYNTGDRRTYEYTPWPDAKLGGGRADLYGRMLLEEIAPFIAGHYRILDGRENTALGGSSLGALAAIYLGLRHADRFGKLAVLSPSVWWKQQAIVIFVNRLEISQRPRIWLDIGTDEGAGSLPDAQMLRAALVNKGWREGDDLLYFEIPGGKHDEAAWAARVSDFLQYLFPVRVVAGQQK